MCSPIWGSGIRGKKEDDNKNLADTPGRGGQDGQKNVSIKNRMDRDCRSSHRSRGVFRRRDESGNGNPDRNYVFGRDIPEAWDAQQGVIP